MKFNLLDWFSYYLLAAFAVGTALRARNYWAMVGLVYRSGSRWPKLRALAKTHRGIFLRWPTVLPVVATLLLTALNGWATQYRWADARVTPGDLWYRPAGLAAAVVAGGLMGLLDFRAAFVFARFDRPAVEAVLDRAEHWLGSWRAPAVRLLTLGLVHPRRIVGEQVRAALVAACVAVNGQLWEMALQIAARIAFGLALWVTWAAALRP